MEPSTEEPYPSRVAAFFVSYFRSQLSQFWWGGVIAHSLGDIKYSLCSGCRTRHSRGVSHGSDLGESQWGLQPSEGRDCQLE